MQHSIVLYTPSVDQSIERLVERLQRLGYRVELRRTADTGAPALEGPFGIVRGSKSISIVVRQLELLGRQSQSS